METANEKLSKRLHEVLDVIGASEYIRKQYWELAVVEEIGFTFLAHLDATRVSHYQVGSKCEGTTTLGYNSDIDTLSCNEERLVVEYLIESKQQGLSYLIFTDEETKPGYVLLQMVNDKCPVTREMFDASESSVFKIDRGGRVFLKHLKCHCGLKTFRNGPADTLPAFPSNGICQTDLVSALRFRRIPMSANSWLHRPRKYEWPSHKQLKTMGSYGCFLVGVAHPCSHNKSIEWRISFTLQERYLISSLNETQYKCYILLKLIKKNIIEPKAGDYISSYHCKTSLLYTIENAQKHCWANDKLIRCARHCLKRLFIWVKAGYCPNYFIPEENMFDKLSLMALKRVENVLKDIIDSDNLFLYSINSDNLGELLKSKLFGSELVNMNTMLELDNPIPRHYISKSNSVYGVRNEILRRLRIFCNTDTVHLNVTKLLLLYLRYTNHVTEHTTRDVRMVLDSLIPHVQLQYEQCLFSQYLSREDMTLLRSEAIPNVISETSDCDLISSKLSLASLCIQSGQFKEECKRILVTCETCLDLYVISVCDCVSKQYYTYPPLAEKLRFTDMTSKYFRLHYTTGCMAFLPLQACLVHKTLQYELFRNVYTTPKLGFESLNDEWLNWITVDSKIYLFFLQYLFYSNTEKRTKKVRTLPKIHHVLMTDRKIGHKETGFNLLGWICLQENDLQSAWRCFCKSWAIRPFNNAAKWHMLMLLSKIIKGK